jgi:hypothetical protein
MLDFRRNIGMLLLTIFLILHGLMLEIGLKFDHEGLILGILALIAGIWLILGR